MVFYYWQRVCDKPRFSGFIEEVIKVRTTDKYKIVGPNGAVWYLTCSRPAPYVIVCPD